MMYYLPWQIQRPYKRIRHKATIRTCKSYQRVGSAAHGFVTAQDEHEGTVANDAHQEDDAKHNRYNICLQSFIVSDVAAPLLNGRSFGIDFFGDVIR